MEEIATGTVLTPSGKADPLPRPERPQPVFGLAIAAEKRADDVKLTGAIGKLIEEDPTLELEQNADTQEMVLWGQGDIHLQIAMDRLRNRHNLAVVGRRRQCPTRRRSGTGPSSIRASSARAAGTASSPTSRSRSSRCRAARALPSSTAWSAARSRATTSRRSRKA